MEKLNLAAIFVAIAIVSTLHVCSAAVIFIGPSDIPDMYGEETPAYELTDAPAPDSGTSAVVTPQGIIQFDDTSAITIHSGVDYSEMAGTPTGATGDTQMYIKFEKQTNLTLHVYMHSVKSTVTWLYHTSK